MGNEIKGKRPDLYCDEEHGRFSHEVFANIYELVTGDSFEVGEAYSLHATFDAATNYFQNEWWRKFDGPLPVYVSKQTLEKLIRKKDKTIFKCWEN